MAQAAAEGLTNQQTAMRLFLSVRTVELHLSNAYRKLGAANRTEASRYLHRRPERLVPAAPEEGLLASAS